MMPGPLIPLPPEFEDSGHSSPGLQTAGIDPTTAAPVDDDAGLCPHTCRSQYPSGPAQ